MVSDRYLFTEIEAKWQAAWEQTRAFKRIRVNQG